MTTKASTLFAAARLAAKGHLDPESRTFGGGRAVHAHFSFSNAFDLAPDFYRSSGRATAQLALESVRAAQIIHPAGHGVGCSCWGYDTAQL